MIDREAFRYLFLGLFLISSNVFGQFRNVKIDEQPTGVPLFEPSVAINPKDVNNIIVTSALNNIYASVDGGQSWSKQKTEWPVGALGTQAVVANASGDFYFFHLSDPGSPGNTDKFHRIISHVSTDGGKTWSEGYVIGLTTLKDQFRPWPVVDAKGNLYVTWTQFDKYGDSDPNCKSVIMMSSSRNGKKWSEPLVVSQEPGDCVDGDKTVMGAMSAHVDGKSFVVWSHDEKIFLDRTYDGTLWLSNDIPVEQQVRGWDLKIPGHTRSNGLPMLLTDKGKSSHHGMLYLLWADQRNGEDNTDIWFVRSANFGDNWTSPMKVNTDETHTHQYSPRMTIDQSTGYLYLVYFDRSEHSKNDLTDVYFAWSKDGGTTFKNVKISEQPFVPDQAISASDFINISAHKGVIVPVWIRMDEGKTSVWTTIIHQEELDRLK